MVAAVRVRKKPQVRRNEILDTAQALFIEKGFMNVTIGDIAQRVGIARPTLYEYFTDKTQIIVGIVDRAIASFEISAPRGETLQQRLTHVAADMLRAFDANRAIYALIFREAPILSETISENLARWRNANASTTRVVMRQAHDNHLLHPEVSVEDAVFVFTALLGQRAGDVLISGEEITVETEAKRLTRMALRSILAPSADVPRDGAP